LYEMKLHVDLSGCWLGRIKNNFPVDITLLDTIPMHNDKSGVQDLVDVDLNGLDPSDIENEIKEMNGIDFVSVSSHEGNKVKMIVGTSSCLGCSALAKAEAFLLSATVLNNGWVEWRVVHDTMEALEDLRESLNNAGMENKVIEIMDYTDRESLSTDQEHVLQTALEMGYFDFPKRAGVRELAKRLGVSTAYISYTLRSAQKRTIQMYLKR